MPKQADPPRSECATSYSLGEVRAYLSHDRLDSSPRDVYVRELLDWLVTEIDRLQNWVNDLQSGMYINCVYCGHRYGPKEDTPSVMADVLREHVEECPKHPLSLFKRALVACRSLLSHPQLIGAEQLAAAHGHTYSDEFNLLAARALRLTQEALPSPRGRPLDPETPGADGAASEDAVGQDDEQD